MCPNVKEFVCKESQELICLYDYQPSDQPLKVKGKRNGQPVIVYFSTLSDTSICSDLSDYSLCQGILEPNAILANVDTSNVFIEQVGKNIVYRSRGCHQLTRGKLEQCEACCNLLLSGQTLWAAEKCKIEMLEKDLEDLAHEKDSKDDNANLDVQHYEDKNGNEAINKENDIIAFKPKKKRKLKNNIPKLKVGKKVKKEWSKEQRERHNNLRNKYSKSEQCPFCLEMFFPYAINNHVTTTHINEKENPVYMKFVEANQVVVNSAVCAECGESFKDNICLSNHLRKEHPDTVGNHFTETCDLCGKAFPTKILLRQHIPVHREEEALCNLCGKSFRNKTRLTSHIKRAHEERPQCKECGKKFPTVACLNKHVKFEHLGIKENQCETCGKYFLLPKLLRLHVQTVHLQIKPWICEVCGFKSTRHGNLNQHRNKSHNLPTLSVKEFKSLVQSGKHQYCEANSLDWNKLAP